MTRPDGTPVSDQVLADAGPAILLIVGVFLAVMAVAAVVAMWRERRPVRPSAAERRLDHLVNPAAPVFTDADYERAYADLAAERAGGSDV